MVINDCTKCGGTGLIVCVDDQGIEIAQICSCGNERHRQALAKRAIESARQRGRFTIFAVVDALTRLSGEMKYAGDRAEVDAKAGKLLALAA